MANLLPKEERTAILNEYRLRRASVCLFLLSALFVLAAVFLLPTLFLVQSESQAVEERQRLLTEAIAVREQDISLDEVAATTEKITVLDNRDAGPLFTDIITMITEDAAGRLTLTRFSYTARRTEEGAARREVRVSGLAAQREGLTQFADALGRRGLFADVDLPVSQLARSRDIDVSLTLPISNPDTP